LADMGIIERSVPPTESNPERSRKGVYGFADHFIGFWFKFIYPFRAEIESGHAEKVMRNLDAHYVDGYLAFVFEKVCRQITWDLRDRIGFGFTRVGSITGAEEFDVVAVDPEGRKAFVAECKYHGRPVTAGVLDRLKEKCSRCRELEGYTVTYGLFSVSGFDENLYAKAKETGDLLIDLQAMDHC
ncbi:MAG: DUF234 domain-containing protein, partial [archaeon]|nr:DUF234 domain-containing protein [archaeon]